MGNEVRNRLIYKIYTFGEVFGLLRLNNRIIPLYAKLLNFFEKHMDADKPNKLFPFFGYLPCL